MSRRIAVIAAFAALALVAAGCGSKSSGSGLDTALSYVPKDSPIVVAFDTDPDGEQFHQLQKLIAKFPFGGQVKQGFKDGFNARAGGFDFDKDVKPLLGNDLVLSASTSSGLRSGGDTPFVAAWKVGDEDVAKRLIQKNATKSGSVDGADIYQSGNSFTAIDDGTLVSSESQADVEAAIKRAGGDDGMSEDDFNSRLDGLNEDALVRVTGDFEKILGADPQTAAARKVKWVAALRTFGVTLSIDPDGIGTAFNVKTDSADLTDADLPLAAGEEAAPVVRRAGEIGVGVRDPAQIIAFGQAVSQTTDPAAYAKYVKDKAKLGKQLGIDIDRDVIAQLTGNAELSVSLTGDFAIRADLKDPAAAEATLKKAAPRLEKVAKGKAVGISTPKNGKGFYAIANPNGKKVVFGVVGKSFVAATDAGRAAQFAGQSPSVVEGAKGALVVASDARALANAVAEQRGQGTAAQIVTGALGDLVGSAQSETSGLTGELKLMIK